MEGLRQTWNERGFLAQFCENVLIIVWRKHPTKEALRLIDSILTEAGIVYPKGIGILVVIEVPDRYRMPLLPPSADDLTGHAAQDAMRSMLAKHKAIARVHAVVLGGSSFSGKSIRLSISTLNLLLGSKWLGVCEDIPNAARWMEAVCTKEFERTASADALIRGVERLITLAGGGSHGKAAAAHG